MLFSIAIPTYNNENTLENAISSCLNQDYNRNYEILIVNNNSNDNTQSILKKFAGKINVINNSQTVTMYENHNICLQHAKGDYVIFCHSDDELLPDALKKFHSILKKRSFPNRYVLWGRGMFYDYYLPWKNSGYNLNEIASGIHALYLFVVSFGFTPSGTCFSKKSFIDNKGFLYSGEALAPNDWGTYIKLVFKYFEFEMSDRIFFKREFASTNKSSVDNKIKYTSRKNVFQNLIDELENNETKRLIDFIYNHPKPKMELLYFLKDLKLLDEKVVNKRIKEINTKGKLKKFIKKFMERTPNKWIGF